MTEKTHGTYKIKRPDGMEDDAHVVYVGGHEMEVPESRYRDQGYLPDFDDLPWGRAETVGMR